MSNMRFIVRGNATDIHRDVTRLKRFEDFFFTGQCVVEV